MSPSLYNSFWKRIYTCRKADCGMNDRKEPVVRNFIRINLPLKLVRPVCVSVNEHKVYYMSATASVSFFHTALTMDLILISTHMGLHLESRIRVSKAISGSYVFYLVP
jgi:hypothetical protein